MLNFRALSTPPNDGDVLVEPAASTLVQLVRANRAQLAAMSGGIGGATWAELRAATRRRSGVPDDRSLIMTGHQPEFVHAGVWAKHVFAHRLAEAAGGEALNLVVDSDVPKTLAVSLPTQGDGGIELQHVAFAERGAGQPYEHLPKLAAAAISRIRERFAQCMGSSFEDSAMPRFLEGFARPQNRDFVEQMTAGRSAVDEAFAVRARDVRVSAVWGGPMLTDWILRAGEFAEAYNQALADYRREEGIRKPDRPIPDLQIDGRRVELPVWTYGSGEPRRRLYVEHDGGKCRFFVESQFVGSTDRRDLERTCAGDRTAAHSMAGTPAGESVAHWPVACGPGSDRPARVIRPRALALTLWARLLANDLFIHGIGGAKYDRITDRIIRTFYAVEPPAMACVSATLLLPLPRQPVGDADLTAARRWVRDVVYQPDRWAAGMGEAAALLADRQRAIGRSDELHRLGPRQAHRSERHELWERIRDLNHRVASLRPDIVTDARSSLAFLQQLFERDRVAASREYFFALFPREKLDTLSRSLSLNRIL